MSGRQRVYTHFGQCSGAPQTHVGWRGGPQKESQGPAPSRNVQSRAGGRSVCKTVSILLIIQDAGDELTQCYRRALPPHVPLSTYSLWLPSPNLRTASDCTDWPFQPPSHQQYDHYYATNTVLCAVALCSAGTSLHRY